MTHVLEISTMARHYRRHHRLGKSMDDLDQKLSRIEDTAERYPLQMLMVREVFSYSYAEAARISARFLTQAEFVEAIDQLRAHVAASDLPDETRADLDARLFEEIEVITFSQTSRCSVISI
jgi:elongation factor P--beta-lysine ligase